MSAVSFQISIALRTDLAHGARRPHVQPTRKETRNVKGLVWLPSMIPGPSFE